MTLQLFSPTQVALLHALIISASLGALIGGIRQWMDQQDAPEGAEGPTHAGIRTFTLWAATGFVCAVIGAQTPWFFSVSFAAFAVFMGAAYFATRGVQPAFGLTTHAAGVLTFLIGALVAQERVVLALVLTGLAMLVLGARRRVRGWTRHLTSQDLYSTLQFVAITGVILPLVPNRWYAIGGFEVFNPYETWLMVVLIAGLGFVGYAAMRVMGARAGIILTGLFGGVASSTATTLAMSRESRAWPTLGLPLAVAVVLACVVMGVRVLAMVLVISPAVFAACLLPFALLSLPGVLFLAWLLFSKRGKVPSTMETPALDNPLSLGMALKFGAIYALVAAAVKVLTAAHVESGVYSLAFLSGLADMAAISVSGAQAVSAGAMTVDVAAKAIVAGALGNTLVKGLLAVWLGRGVFRTAVFYALAATFACGVAAFFLI